MSIVRGCQVNLRNKEEQFISKGWKLMTTNEKLSKLMQVPCTCQPNTINVPCESILLGERPTTPKNLPKRVCRCLQQGMNYGAMCWEMERERIWLGYHFLLSCWGTPPAGLTCGHCTQGFVQGLKYQGTQQSGVETNDGGKDQPDMAAAVWDLVICPPNKLGANSICFMRRRDMDPSKIL